MKRVLKVVQFDIVSDETETTDRSPVSSFPSTMVEITILVSNPIASRVETGSAEWIVSGTRPGRVAETIDEDTRFATVTERAKSLPGEYTVFQVRAGGDAAVRAYRGLASSFNAFYYRQPSEDTFVLGDHFRDILSTLPASDRTVPPSVPADQLLLGTRPTRTYVEEIGRLGHGERLEWTPGDGLQTDLVETLSNDERLDVSEAKRRLDHHFRNALDVDRFSGSSATMLSGGVDSTLLHTYVDTDDTVSGAVDSPEFQFEVEYARKASNLLDTDHEFVAFDEDAFLERVESTIDATGYPLLLPQDTVMHAAIAGSNHQNFVNGGLADGLFGTGTAALSYLAQYVGSISQYVPNVTGEIQQLADTAEQLKRPAFDPDGTAMNFRIHSDQDHVAAIFGQDTVNGHKHDRLQYTRQRVDVDDQPGYNAHMHLGHFLEYFHDNILTIWRHAAHAHGNALVTPFAGREVLETAAAISPSERYARFALPPKEDPTRVVQYKYLLKELLTEKIPAYNAKKPKGHSQLPTGRYFDSGVLSDVFDQYEMPAFVPESHRDAVRDGTEEITWYAFNYAVWRDRILTNDDLEPFETTTVIQREIPGNHLEAR